MLQSSMETKQIWSQEAPSYNAYIQEELNDFHFKAWQWVILEDAPKGRMLNILDVGTGPGFFPIILGSLGHQVTGIDLSEEMMRIANHNIKVAGVDGHCQILERDALHTGFASDSFDMVISRNVTWTLEKPDCVYAEWHRILKPEGTLQIFDSAWFNYLFDKKERTRIKRYLTRYHKLTGQLHDTFEFDDVKDEYRRNRPLSCEKRPEWDYETLLKLEFHDIKIDKHIGELLYSKEETLKYGVTPMFKICATK